MPRSHQPKYLDGTMLAVIDQDQLGKSLTDVMRVGLQPEVVLLTLRAALIDDERSGVRDDDAAVPVQHFHATFKVRGRHHVVVRVPAKVLASRQLDPKVVISCRADVLHIASVANSRVVREICAADFFGAIRRGVVANDDFKIVKRLREQ